MKITSLLLFLAFLLTAAGETGSLETVCLSAEENKLYDLMMAYRKTKGLESIPLSAKAHASSTDACERSGGELRSDTRKMQPTQLVEEW
jgi:hypothetical protein